MKKRLVLFVLTVFIGFLGIFAYTQKNNIMGVWYSFKYSNEDIEGIIEETDDSLKKNMEDIIGHPIRAFSDEENKLIEEGKATEKEIVEKIIKEELEKVGGSAENVNKTDSSYYITELYSLKNRYIGILDGMVKSAVDEYKALDKKQRTRSKKLEIGASYARKATALEAECDAKVDAIIKALENSLKANGKSTQIISDIYNTYNTEKNLKRAYYLNMFK